ncbi:hypothetical protein SUGI_0028140 [Cryptomeria japonica]|uniref:uncharacterized protein LOC131042878 isoform X2 n=1 Tax=Cryptomeria japonica TaxID=3369 RepID=UPI002408CC21|nr:uncharacterized protein LOC131042878 isoform X2 [Cryptomeria japonica]GLJ05915.1 hypothetical protein SUGI_0028140 [Cryptomeria japonica]
MSWLRNAMNRAAEVGVGGRNNLTRTVKTYAGTVVQQAGQAVAEGAKIIQDRMSVRNMNNFKHAVRRLEEVALSARGMERFQALGRWLVALKEIEKDSKSGLPIGDRNNEQAQIPEDERASPRKASLVLFYDSDSGTQPMNFRDVFLHSQALENIAISMILEVPSDDEVPLLLELFELCLTGGKEVHNAIVSSIQDLAKAFSGYQEEVLVKRDELLHFVRVAITGLKLNAELIRIDGEVRDLKYQIAEELMLDSGHHDFSNVSPRKSGDALPVTIEGLKRSEETIRKCSRLQFLLERKKAILHSGDSEESHTQKVDKLRLLAESLSVSTTKAEKQIADNRHQKEEALNYRVAKANEVTEVEKELSAEIETLDKRRVELEEELKKVNVAIAAVNKRRINAQEEKEQFFEASTQIVSHLKMKEDELTRSVAQRKTESVVVNTWTNFLEDTWILQSSQSQQKEQAVKDALEEANRQFLQFVISKLPAYKEDLDVLLDELKAFSKAINDMSNKRSQFDQANESEVSERRKVEEKYLEAESQAITIFRTVDSMKAEFYAHEKSSFRNAEDEGKTIECFGMIDQMRQKFEVMQRPILELEPVTPKENIASTEEKPSENLSESLQSLQKEDKEQLPGSVQESDRDFKPSEDVLDPEAELAKLESEFGKSGEGYSSQEIGGWEFDELEEELRSNS